MLLKVGWLLKKTCHNHAVTAVVMSPEHKNIFFDAFLVTLSSCNICFPYYLPCRSLSSLRKLFLSGQTILPRVHSLQWLQTFHGFFITTLRERTVLVSIKNTRILLPPSQLISTEAWCVGISQCFYLTNVASHCTFTRPYSPLSP